MNDVFDIKEKKDELGFKEWTPIIMVIVAVLLAFFGNAMFNFLGLPAWSKGDEGYNYPAFFALILGFFGLMKSRSYIKKNESKINKVFWNIILSIIAICVIVLVSTDFFSLLK